MTCVIFILPNPNALPGSIRLSVPDQKKKKKKKKHFISGVVFEKVTCKTGKIRCLSARVKHREVKTCIWETENSSVQLVHTI